MLLLSKAEGAGSVAVHTAHSFLYRFGAEVWFENAMGEECARSSIKSINQSVSQARENLFFRTLCVAWVPSCCFFFFFFSSRTLASNALCVYGHSTVSRD